MSKAKKPTPLESLTAGQKIVVGLITCKFGDFLRLNPNPQRLPPAVFTFRAKSDSPEYRAMRQLSRKGYVTSTWNRWYGSHTVTFTKSGWLALGFPLIAQYKKYVQTRNAVCNTQSDILAANGYASGIRDSLQSFNEAVNPRSVMGKLSQLQRKLGQAQKQIAVVKRRLKHARTPTLAQLRANVIAEMLQGGKL